MTWILSNETETDHEIGGSNIALKMGLNTMITIKNTGAKPYFKPKSSISRTLLIALLRALTVHQLIFLERISAHSFAGIERPIACQ